MLSNHIQTVRMKFADFRGRGVFEQHATREYIFIHIPKTGGSSVAKALHGGPSSHQPAQLYLRANSRKFARYFSFAFVRNPYDRLVSSFHFLKSGGMNEQDRTWAEQNLGQVNDFADFVQNCLTLELAESWVHLRPQCNFITNLDGDLCIDFIGRFESIDADFEQIARRLNLDARLEKTNVGSRDKYENYYDDSLRAKVAQIYRRDFDLLGYSTDG